MRFKAPRSAPGPTQMRRPFANSISMRLSAVLVSPTGLAFFAEVALRETGRNAGALAGFASICAISRQRNRMFGLILCRRATAETFSRGRKASATIASFSSSLHRRRVSAKTEYCREKPSPEIGAGLAPVVTTVTYRSYPFIHAARRPSPEGHSTTQRKLKAINLLFCFFGWLALDQPGRALI